MKNIKEKLTITILWAGVLPGYLYYVNLHESYIIAKHLYWLVLALPLALALLVHILDKPAPNESFVRRVRNESQANSHFYGAIAGAIVIVLVLIKFATMIFY